MRLALGHSPLSREPGAQGPSARSAGDLSCGVRPVASLPPLTLVPFSPTDVAFITTVTFVWKVSAITVVSCLPLYVLKYLKRKLSPPSYSKLTS